MTNFSNITKAKGQAGFTMIEISIGLVVVGLLMAGVLKGGEFIASAKQKSLLSQIDSFKSAVYLSAENPRLHGLLGDGFYESSTLNPLFQSIGNQDGIISLDESRSAVGWLHDMNLVEGDDNLNAYRGETFIATNVTRNDGRIEICSTGIPAKDLREISLKIDNIDILDGQGAVRGGPLPNGSRNSIPAVSQLILASPSNYVASFSSPNELGFMCMSI